MASVVFSICIFGFKQIHAQDSTIVLHLKSSNFFVNNEYSGSRLDGCTLPGFTLRPYIEWRIEPRVTIEVGTHWLHYWGNNGFHYGINEVHPLANDTTQALHFLPWMQARIQFAPWGKLVLGSLVNTDGHGMPLPLYNPERLYATDPESGLQLLFDHKYIKADIWVDWREFIWYHSKKQEMFFAGSSIRPQLPLSDNWKLSLPLAFIVQHRGGEGLADTSMGHISRYNMSAGLSVSYKLGDFSISAEGYAMYYSRSGHDETTPVHDASGRLLSEPIDFKQGSGYLATLKAAYHDNEAEAGYWSSEKFMPLQGCYHFSNISLNTPKLLFDRIQTLYLKVRHTWPLGPCSLTLEGAYYYYPPSTGDRTGYWKCYFPAESMYAFGIHFNLNNLNIKLKD